jgi:hypothetical protein
MALSNCVGLAGFSSSIVLITDKVTGEWRRLYSEELNDLYSHQILFG